MTENYTIIESLRKKRDDLLHQFLPDNIYDRIVHFDAVIASLAAETTVVAAPLYTPTFQKEQFTVQHPLYTNYSLKDAVLKFIKDQNRFVTTRQIADGIASSFPDKKKDMDKFRIQISGVVSALGRDNKLMKYQYGPGVRDTAWGAKSWLDSKGVPLEGREPVIEVKDSIDIEFD